MTDTAVRPRDPTPRPRRRPHRPASARCSSWSCSSRCRTASAASPASSTRPVNAPGTLQLLALCLVFGALATGLRPVVRPHRDAVLRSRALLRRRGLRHRRSSSPRPAGRCGAIVLAGGLGTATLAALLGAIALRTNGIAFAMVTLAFAQVGAITIGRDPGGVTGGEEGLPMDTAPGAVRAGRRRQHGEPVLARRSASPSSPLIVVHAIAGAPAGRVLAAIRDDERRVGVLGLDPYRYRLFAFTVAGGLAGARRRHVRAADRRRDPARRRLRPDPDAAGDGGPGRARHPLGAADRRFLFTYLDYRLAPLVTPTRWTACRACCAGRCRSRCSSSGRCSSSRCTSSPAAWAACGPASAARPVDPRPPLTAIDLWRRCRSTPDSGSASFRVVPGSHGTR